MDEHDLRGAVSCSSSQSHPRRTRARLSGPDHRREREPQPVGRRLKRGVRTGDDKLPHVERRLAPSSSSTRASCHTRTAVGSEKANVVSKRPSILALPIAQGGRLSVVRARELDRELVKPGAGDTERGSERRRGGLAHPAQPIHTDSASDDPRRGARARPLALRSAQHPPEPRSPTSIPSATPTSLPCLGRLRIVAGPASLHGSGSLSGGESVEFVAL